MKGFDANGASWEINELLLSLADDAERISVVWQRQGNGRASMLRLVAAMFRRWAHENSNPD